MKPILKLNRWTTYLFIFAPIVIIIVLYNIPFFNTISYGMKFVIVNFVQNFTIAFLYGLQFYLGRNFFKSLNKKAYFFNINGVIPLIFWTVACIWFVYHIPTYLKIVEMERTLSSEELLTNRIIYVFIFHYTITYLFINNLLVKYELRKIGDSTSQTSLKERYYIPMKKIIRISWLILLGLLIYTFSYHMMTH